jgi:hypothetical protein
MATIPRSDSWTRERTWALVRLVLGGLQIAGATASHSRNLYLKSVLSTLRANARRHSSSVDR